MQRAQDSLTLRRAKIQLSINGSSISPRYSFQPPRHRALLRAIKPFLSREPDDMRPFTAGTMAGEPCRGAHLNVRLELSLVDGREDRRCRARCGSICAADKIAKACSAPIAVLASRAKCVPFPRWRLLTATATIALAGFRSFGH
jgi:hypothetical protein